MAANNGVDTIWSSWHVQPGEWTIEVCPEFGQELLTFPEEAQDELLAHAALLKQCGPSLARPYADTLKGSRHPNMKELRFEVSRKPWRAAFAFDPGRKGILLVAGCKSGIAQKLFYRRLIARADSRFDAHLARIGRARR